MVAGVDRLLAPDAVRDLRLGKRLISRAVYADEISS